MDIELQRTDYESGQSVVHHLGAKDLAILALELHGGGYNARQVAQAMDFQRKLYVGPVQLNGGIWEILNREALRQ